MLFDIASIKFNGKEVKTNEEGSRNPVCHDFRVGDDGSVLRPGGSGGKAGSRKKAAAPADKAADKKVDDKAKATDKKAEPKKDAKKADKKKAPQEEAKKDAPKADEKKAAPAPRCHPRKEVSYPIYHLKTGLPEGHRKNGAPRVA